MRIFTSLIILFLIFINCKSQSTHSIKIINKTDESKKLLIKSKTISLGTLNVPPKGIIEYSFLKNNQVYSISDNKNTKFFFSEEGKIDTITVIKDNLIVEGKTKELSDFMYRELVSGILLVGNSTSPNKLMISCTSEKKSIEVSDSLYNEKNKEFNVIKWDNYRNYKLSTVKYYKYKLRKLYADISTIRDSTYKYTQSFLNYTDSIYQDTEEIAQETQYLEIVKSLIFVKYINTLTIDEAKDFRNTYWYHIIGLLRFIDGYVKTPALKSFLANEIAPIYLNYTSNDNHKELLNLYDKLNNDEKKREDLIIAINDSKKIAKGAKISKFEFNDFKGEKYTLDKFKGKMVLIDFWATWCGPCIKEFPYMDKLYEKVDKSKVEFISISVYEKPEAARKYLDKNPYPWPQFYAKEDNLKHIISQFQIKEIPRYILIDKQGKLIDGDAKTPSNPKLLENIEMYY